MAVKKVVLWWGKFDPEYSRNRILRKSFSQLGWDSGCFIPKNSRLAYLEARLRNVAPPDLVFVPCFCQKDIDSALTFGRYCNVPVLIDPLISLYDTRVFERRTVTVNSRDASRLLSWESRSFSLADGVIADTEEHGNYFSDVLGVDSKRIYVVPVGAEEPLFSKSGMRSPVNKPVQVLFYGSFIPLQGVDVIIDAIRCYQGPPVLWCLLGGDGSSLKTKYARILSGFDNVVFEQNIPYKSLPKRIHQADILLGVFGRAEKTVRVIPNKVYQSMACAKPVVTCKGPYPVAMRDDCMSGVVCVSPGDAYALAEAVASLASDPDFLPVLGDCARRSYERFFDNEVVTKALGSSLSGLLLAV